MCVIPPPNSSRLDPVCTLCIWEDERLCAHPVPPGAGCWAALSWVATEQEALYRLDTADLLHFFEVF